VDVVRHQLGFACPGTPKAGGVAVGVTIGILPANARLLSATGGAKAALLPFAHRAAANRIILAASRRGYRVIEPVIFSHHMSGPDAGCRGRARLLVRSLAKAGA
jgi:hypothetical protein